MPYYKHSEETKRKIAKSLTGKVSPMKGKRGLWHQTEDAKRRISESGKGLKCPTVSNEHRRKLSEAGKGRIPWNKGKLWNKEVKDKIRVKAIGRKQSEETIRKRVLANKGTVSGEKNWNWKGGITPINEKIRKSLEYRLWRTAVFERDNYQCIWGGKEHGSKLQADHIKPFAYFPELRFAIDNGRTLCVECHKKTDSYLKHKGKLK